jgi:hypothetical protein
LTVLKRKPLPFLREYFQGIPPSVPQRKAWSFNDKIGVDEGQFGVFEIELALGFGEVLVTLQVVEDSQVGDDDLFDGLLVFGVKWKILDVLFFLFEAF